MGNSCGTKPTIDGKPTLIYWNLHSRGDIPQAFFWAGNVEYDNDYDSANSWPEKKDETPFGQLPVLKHGSLVIAQGGSINRYAAKLAGLYPKDPVETAICDMYMEEMLDIFSEVYKAKRAPDNKTKIEQWKRIEEEFIPQHFGNLEKLLEKSRSPFFCGDSCNAADVSFFAVYNIYEKASLDMESIIDQFPKLKKLLAETKKVGKLSEFPDRSVYFTSDQSHESF